MRLSQNDDDGPSGSVRLLYLFAEPHKLENGLPFFEEELKIRKIHSAILCSSRGLIGLPSMSNKLHHTDRDRRHESALVYLLGFNHLYISATEEGDWIQTKVAHSQKRFSLPPPPQKKIISEKELRGERKTINVWLMCSLCRYLLFSKTETKILSLLTCGCNQLPSIISIVEDFFFSPPLSLHACHPSFEETGRYCALETLFIGLRG